MDKNAEKKNGRSRAGLVFAVITVIVSVVAIVLACTSFFRVENIEVNGKSRYETEEIISAAGVPRGSNLILTPNDQVAQRVWDKLPYIGEVEVKKHFPTTLKVNVIDTVAAAIITSGDTRWVIDPGGRVLEEAQEGTDYGCLTVTGLDLMAPQQGKAAQVLEENAVQFAGLTGLMTALRNQEMLGEITEINASSKTEISMMYQGRLKVKFLLGADYERKMRIFREIVLLIGEYETGTVDLKTERGCFTPTM